MLFLFLSLVFSHNFESDSVKPLTSRMWESTIDNRKPDEVWVVMFYGGYCPACVMAAPEFSKAAKRLKGFVNFGNVDIQKNGYLASTFNIMAIPAFFIFHRDGYDEYSGGRRAEDFIEAINPFYEGCLKPYNENMVKGKGPNAAVFFSNRKDAPVAWKLLSCKYSKIATFSYSDDAYARIKLGAVNPPGIFMRNKTYSVTLTKTNDLSKNVKDFFEGKYEEPYVEPQMYLPSELKSECVEPTKLCIIVNKDDTDDEINKIASKYSRNVKFFLGDEWENPSLLKQEFSIIIPGSKGYVPIKKVTDLERTIESCIDGNSRKCRMLDFND